MNNQLDDRLKVDYEATVQYFLHLSDVRFKLLGALPALTALAVALLPRNIEHLRGLAIAILGLLVTLGIMIYDQRNTQIYDCLVARAKRLEREIQGTPPRVPGGPFNDRPPRRAGFDIKGIRLGLLWHDLALAIVYAACLGVWASLVQNRWAIMNNDSEAAPIETGGLVFALTFLLLVGFAIWNDLEHRPTDTQGDGRRQRREGPIKDQQNEGAEAETPPNSVAAAD